MRPAPAARRRDPLGLLSGTGRASAMLDRLLRGPGWIACIGVLLAGIVFFNVGLLELNRDITRTSERAAALGRENARLRLEVTRLGSTERIQAWAAARGLISPAPGDVSYLEADPSVDAARAARRAKDPAGAAATGSRAPASAPAPNAVAPPNGVAPPPGRPQSGAATPASPGTQDRSPPNTTP